MQPLNLTTIESFATIGPARVALNLLASGGIKGVLSNETIILNDWLLGNAVGDVQLQVAGCDVDRAIEILKSRSEISPDELAELALAEPPEEPSEPLLGFFYPDGNEHSSEAIASPDSDVDNDQSPTLNSREVLVDYAYRGAILSFLFCVLIPFVTWNVISILSDSQPLSETHRRKLKWTLALHIPTLMIAVLLLRFLFQAANTN